MSTNKRTAYRYVIDWCLSKARLSHTLLLMLLLYVFPLSSILAEAAVVSGSDLASDSGPITAKLQAQRLLYDELNTSLNKGRLTYAQQRLDRLADYPLKPYIETKILSRQLESQSSDTINQFIANHQDLPAAAMLQQKWLNTLAARKNWRGYQSAYQQFPARGSHYKCLMLKAEMKLGHLASQLDKVTAMWVQGESQPKSCDPVFSYWERKGGLTSSIAETRFWNAVEARNFSLARYIEKKIDQKQGKKDAKLFWQVRNNPERWLKTKTFSADNKTHLIIIDYAIRRLAQKNLRLAAQRWLTLRTGLNVDHASAEKLNYYLSIRLATRFYDDAEALIAKLDPQYQDAEITQWRIRLALSKQNWGYVQQLIARLPEKERLSSRWHYWQAVAEQNITGKAQDVSFGQIAGDRSYYGFLASEQLGQPFSLNYEPAVFSAELQQKLLRLPAVQRMQELVQLGQFGYARQEWNLIFARLDAEQRHALAHLAKGWQWHSQAIVGAAQISKWNDLQLRFPLEYQDLYQTFTGQQKIPLNWALSITRQESAFNPMARSGVGAMGLMQLMPATAKQTARRSKQPLKNMKELYNPKTNIALGTAYLAQMLERFNGSRIYATAAYNAGPHRVKQWLEQRGHLPLDVWIELIPFKETRRYVQRVLEYGVVYDMMASRPAHLLQDNERELLALNLIELDNVVKLDDAIAVD